MLSSLFTYTRPDLIIIIGFIASNLIDFIDTKFLFLNCNSEVHKDNEGDKFKISEQIIYDLHC
jgi:hypothetical protein